MSLFSRLVVVTLPLVPKPIVGRVASRYVAGESLDDAVEMVKKLNLTGAVATMDVLGEEVSERQKAVEAVGEYIRLFENIDAQSLDSNVSIKPTLLGLKIDEQFCLENIICYIFEVFQVGQPAFFCSLNHFIFDIYTNKSCTYFISILNFDKKNYYFFSIIYWIENSEKM